MAFSLFLYLLELENDKYYVGQTTDVDFRFKDHKSGKGAKWTKMHRPLCELLRRAITVESAGEAVLLENEMTLRYMEIFGWENVRGGQFVVVEPYWLQERVGYIYNFELNKINYYVPNCKYLFGSTSDWHVYVLELENGRFYVGSSRHLGKSLGEHFCGKGIAWTRDNKVVKVLELVTIPPGAGSYLHIKAGLQSDYMDRYGRDYVMGGQLPPRK